MPETTTTGPTAPVRRRRRRLLGRLVARAKPVVPDAVWPVLLTVRSLAGDGPVLGLPAVDRVLVLVAHPDDEALSCGGTIALLADAGACVEVLALTDGDATIGAGTDPTETGRRRRSELVTSAAILGATVTPVGLPDGALRDHGPAIVDAIDEALARIRPELVIVPWLGDGHADHRAVAFALARAALDPDVDVWGAEAWTAVPANRVVDIGDAIERKRAAVAAHVTAAQAFDLTAGLGLSRWRSMHGLMGRGHAEAFLATSGAEFVAMADRLAALDVEPGDPRP